MREATTFSRILEMKLRFEFGRKLLRSSVDRDGFLRRGRTRACLNDDGKIPSEKERLTSDNYQFGFKLLHSTSICTNVLKSTVDNYARKGSHVFACFVDFSKAFDNVNFWQLFCKLLDCGIPRKAVALIAFWYSSQACVVKW